MRKVSVLMLEYVKKLLHGEKIEKVMPIPLKKCTVTKEYLLKRAQISDGTAFMFVIPYLSENYKERNISAYAVPQDYHYYFSGLRERMLSALRKKFPKHKFDMFTDHSPIDERNAAALSGLGMIGKNHMLITEDYSSYVFIGEIITDALFDCPNVSEVPNYCIGCGRCVEKCPMNTDKIMCLSAITQKKGELDESEKEAVIKYGCAWGCDICQEVCPHTAWAIKAKTIYTKIPFFNQNLTPVLSRTAIEEMSDEEFQKRAYSWRGTDTVLRNLDLLGYK